MLGIFGSWRGLNPSPFRRSLLSEKATSHQGSEGPSRSSHGRAPFALPPATLSCTSGALGLSSNPGCISLAGRYSRALLRGLHRATLTSGGSSLSAVFLLCRAMLISADHCQTSPTPRPGMQQGMVARHSVESIHTRSCGSLPARL